MEKERSMMTELLTAGWQLHQAGDLPRAEQAYRQLLHREPENAQGWYLLGALYQERGEFAAAGACLDKALSLRPAYSEAHNLRGLVFIKQLRLPEATACFRAALRVEP